MSIEHWIILYLFANGILCYLGGADSYDDLFTLRNAGKAILGAAFALPITIGVLTVLGLNELSIWLGGVFQFRTYWRYLFARHRLIFDDRELMTHIYRRGQEMRSSNSIRDRIWRHAESLIHKVNKFTPPKP